MRLRIIPKRPTSPPESIRECRACGYSLVDPYRCAPYKVLCSTCLFLRNYEYSQSLKAEQHKREDWSEAKCECGMRLPDCQVATCHREIEPERQHARLKKPPRGNQPSLF